MREPSAYDVVVMDAEPLVTYFTDSAGAERVEEFLLAVEHGDIDGYLHDVTQVEVCYVCARVSDAEVAEEYVETLVGNGFRTDVPEETWRDAARIKTDHPIAIGDAYALSAARSLAEVADDEVLLLVGGDGDFEPFLDGGRCDGLDVVRFRDG